MGSCECLGLLNDAHKCRVAIKDLKITYAQNNTGNIQTKIKLKIKYKIKISFNTLLLVAIKDRLRKNTITKIKSRLIIYNEKKNIITIINIIKNIINFRIKNVVHSKQITFKISINISAKTLITIILGIIIKVKMPPKLRLKGIINKTLTLKFKIISSRINEVVIIIKVRTKINTCVLYNLEILADK